MPTAMTVRCNQCGHENNPDYRFCGMCGAPLPVMSPAREPERARVSPVGGPSFLGLGDDRVQDLDYLLDDEPPRGHGRLYLALLLLVLSGALLAWHWQRDGYPWAGLIQGSIASHSSANSTSAPASAPVTPTQPTGNAAPPVTQSASSPAMGEKAQAATTEPPGDAAPSPNIVAAAKPAEQASAPADSSAPKESTAKPSADAVPQDDESAEPAPTKAAPEPAPDKEGAAPARKPAAAKPSPAMPVVSAEDRLVDEGERYLYGRGVRPDCGLAQRNLMIGARQSNPKAQTLLGAMYATGHCVGRDLPTAYRWFAKALHGDPSNTRVQRDLEVLWKQMTQEERQLAMKSQ